MMMREKLRREKFLGCQGGKTVIRGKTEKGGEPQTLVAQSGIYFDNLCFWLGIFCPIV